MFMNLQLIVSRFVDPTKGWPEEACKLIQQFLAYSTTYSPLPNLQSTMHEQNFVKIYNFSSKSKNEVYKTDKADISSVKSNI